jgi:hypothetical protein
MRKEWHAGAGRWIEVEDVSAPTKSKAEGRHIGCPVWFLRRAVEATGGDPLAVALYLYRLRHIHRDKTVKVPNGWLERELGISRYVKYRAIHALEAAGILRVHPRNGKEAVVVTFLV